MKRYFKNISLLPFNTLGVDVKAAHFFTIGSVEDLTNILSAPEYSHLFTDKEKVIVLGQGSNILFTNDFDGVILKNEIKSIKVVEENYESIYLKVGAGFVWDKLVQYSMSGNWAGIENLVLIPGTVGAAPVQNIGAYGVEIADVIEKIDFYDFESKQLITLKQKDCAFGYRDSIFKHALKHKGVICYVTLRLNKIHTLHMNYGIIKDQLKNNKIHNPSIQDIAQAIRTIRTNKLPDPLTLGNAGSFFKNPFVNSIKFQELISKFPDIPFNHTGDQYKMQAGWLIEKAGWKGCRKNNVGCYEKQALILVNYNHATGQEILQFADEIQSSVFNLFGIQLEKEVNVIY